MKDKRKSLILLTILEGIVLIICIIAYALTFNYMTEVTLNNFTAPWIGTSDLSTKYNIALMNFLITVGDVGTMAFLLINIFRFILIKFKYKMIFLASIITFVANYILYFKIHIDIVFFVFLIASLIGYIYSHKIDKNL